MKLENVSIGRELCALAINTVASRGTLAFIGGSTMMGALVVAALLGAAWEVFRAKNCGMNAIEGLLKDQSSRESTVQQPWTLCVENESQNLEFASEESPDSTARRTLERAAGLAVISFVSGLMMMTRWRTFLTHLRVASGMFHAFEAGKGAIRLCKELYSRTACDSPRRA
jgi:hypothetical protein